MKKIISFKIKSMQEYCCTFFQLLNVSFSKFNFITPIYWRQSYTLPLMLTAILMTGYKVNAQGSIKGIVPVQHPIGGSGVDGDAWAHEPIGSIYENVGDLFDKLYDPVNNPTHTVNHGVLDLTTGALLYPGSTFFLQDRYQNDLTIFTLSNKINDNPNTYTWGAGSSPNKNEIQNAGAHFSYGDSSIRGGDGVTGAFGDPNDLWCLFAGDRQVTNGSSYIDFEFLQKSLTITGATFGPLDPATGTAPITGGSGGFATEGTQGGRTVGDILVTIEFTQGGGDANVVIRKWTQIGTGVYEYVIVPNNAPGIAGNIYCTNNTVTTTVPFDAYGTTPGTYAPNQWAEGAINLTKVFEATNNPCLVISTLFVRTRSSGNSAQSELKDFPGAPIQLKLCSDKTPPVISALPEATTINCPSIPAFATPTATDNCTLKSLTSTDVTTPGNCAGNYSVTRTWTATDDCGNTSTATQTINVHDVTAPVIAALPAASTINCPAVPSFAQATATDACDASVTLTFADVRTDGKNVQVITA
ncbi:hypothetical protein [Flavobacterium sp. AED]|uniref:HYR-like domain-containing protein n=1 Tax=Flavobacterium sp. AED TaxID=1423323 RepID=UPI0012E030D7|nr:hypothetical protein [Flavobacterium sp. AED]